MCGFHYFDASSSIKYAWVGIADNSTCAGCFTQKTSSPNGNPAVDSAISGIAHEVAEAATDPLLTAWYYQKGKISAENADQCAWYFPDAVQNPTTGAKSNIKVGEMDYYIQAMWSLDAKDCVMH